MRFLPPRRARRARTRTATSSTSLGRERELDFLQQTDAVISRLLNTQAPKCRTLSIHYIYSFAARSYMTGSPPSCCIFFLQFYISNILFQIVLSRSSLLSNPHQIQVCVFICFEQTILAIQDIKKLCLKTSRQSYPTNVDCKWKREREKGECLQVRTFQNGGTHRNCRQRDFADRENMGT